MNDNETRIKTADVLAPEIARRILELSGVDRENESRLNLTVEVRPTPVGNNKELCFTVEDLLAFAGVDVEKFRKSEAFLGERSAVFGPYQPMGGPPAPLEWEKPFNTFSSQFTFDRKEIERVAGMSYETAHRRAQSGEVKAARGGM